MVWTPLDVALWFVVVSTLDVTATPVVGRWIHHCSWRSNCHSVILMAVWRNVVKMVCSGIWVYSVAAVEGEGVVM